MFCQYVVVDTVEAVHDLSVSDPEAALTLMQHDQGRHHWEHDFVQAILLSQTIIGVPATRSLYLTATFLFHPNNLVQIAHLTITDPCPSKSVTRDPIRRCRGVLMDTGLPKRQSR